MSDPSEAIERLSRWFRDRAVPLWAPAAWDERHGGFYESLSFDGQPIRGPRRVRVQSRQVYTFSMIGLREWQDEAETIAAQGFDYLMRRACPDEGERGCVHTLADDGAVIDAKRDLYDQAFLLLACAGRIEAANCEKARVLAQRTVDFLDRELASPHGGWVESDKQELPRRQNPHMHLFEAFMALYRATGDNRYFEKAGNLLRLFRGFIDPTEGVLREYFTDAFTFEETRREIEPGHMFEWVWLLNKYEQIADFDASDDRKLLFARAEHYGPDRHFFGFVSNKVDISAPPIRGAKRLWPQTEYLKASCVEAAMGDAHARDMIPALVDAMFSTYLNTKKPGLWIDEFDAHGAPIAADVPASILYHLYEAVAECLRFAEGKERL